MANGIRVWNSAGQLTLDTGDRITRFVARYGFSLNANQYAGVTVPGWSDDGTWAYFCSNQVFEIVRSGGYFQLRGLQQGSYGELLIFRY